MAGTPTLPTNREGSGTHLQDPTAALYGDVSFNSDIMPQSAMNASNGKYGDGKRAGHPL